MVYPFGFKAERRSKPIVATFPVSHCSDVGLAQPTGRPEQRIEHGSKVECRAADDLEHVGGRGLLLQRFCKIARLGLDLVEQANILDGYHSLVGESGNQGYLLFSKKLNALAREYNDADQLVLAQQRDAEGRMLSGER